MATRRDLAARADILLEQSRELTQRLRVNPDKLAVRNNEAVFTWFGAALFTILAPAAVMLLKLSTAVTVSAVIAGPVIGSSLFLLLYRLFTRNSPLATIGRITQMQRQVLSMIEEAKRAKAPAEVLSELWATHKGLSDQLRSITTSTSSAPRLTAPPAGADAAAAGATSVADTNGSAHTAGPARAPRSPAKPRQRVPAPAPVAADDAVAAEEDLAAEEAAQAEAAAKRQRG